MKHSFRITCLAVFLTSLPTWALEVSGVPNFHLVNDHICRGAQPTKEGWNSLAKLGVTTVVDLRHDTPGTIAWEKKAVEAAGMQYVSIPFRGFGAPTDAEVMHVLDLFKAQSKGYLFVHCRRGADRTGTVIACYRISCDHWPQQKALQEAKSFGMSWMEMAMQRYVMHYQLP